MVSIEINPETTLLHIQKTFSKEFPFLKLEFFQKPHQKKEGSPKDEMITDAHTQVGKLSSIATDKVVVIHKNMAVSDLESLFEKQLHLHIQVFHQAGKLWLESIETDGLSLEKLNNRSKLRNEKIGQEELGDYHEQE